MAENNIEQMIEQTRDEAESGRMTIKRRGDELRAEIMEIENTLLEDVNNCEETRLGILLRRREELREQRGYVVAVSDALDITFEKPASYQFAPASYGKIIVGTRPLEGLTKKYDLQSKIHVTEVLHYDINVIEPASNSQCWVTHTNEIFLYSRDRTRKIHFRVTDKVIDMETCQSGKTTFVALENNDVLKIRRKCDLEYLPPIRVFRTQGSIGSIAVDSSNRLFVFDAKNPFFRTYDEHGNNMSERKPLPATMRKVRSGGHHAIFAASITDNVVTIKTVNRSNGTTVTLAREGMEATQVCHCNLGFFAVLGYNSLKLRRFAEDGLFIDVYELGQNGLFTSDNQWNFRFSTFSADREGNFWVGEQHGNVKIYSPFIRYGGAKGT